MSIGLNPGDPSEALPPSSPEEIRAAVAEYQAAWKGLDEITPASDEAKIDEWQGRYNAAVERLLALRLPG